MTDPAVVVRFATTDDAPACAAIYAPYVIGTTITFETVPPTPQQMADRIEASLNGYAWLVLERSGQVVGYACSHRFAERAAYAWSCETSIYVHPDARGMGAGRALYAALLPILAERGYRRAYAGITQPNDPSMAIHARFGFETVGVFRQVGWKDGRWLDVAWLQRDLVAGDRGEPPAELR